MNDPFLGRTVPHAEYPWGGRILTWSQKDRSKPQYKNRTDELASFAGTVPRVETWLTAEVEFRDSQAPLYPRVPT